jgi:signal transduction histidine kinase
MKRREFITLLSAVAAACPIAERTQRPIESRTILQRIIPILRAAWIAPIIISCPIETNAADLRRVLLLHSFGTDYSPWGETAASLRADLYRSSPDPIDLYEASVFTVRFEKPQEENPLVEYLDALFSEHKLDLMIAMGGPAVSFVQRHRSSLFPPTPMLMTGVAEQRIDKTKLTVNDAVVGLDLNLRQYIDNILRLRPDTTDILVVIGNSSLEQYWLGDLRRQYQVFANRVNFTWSNDLSLMEVLNKAAHLPPHTSIFYFLFAVDAQGVPHAQGQALAALREVANAPIFGFGDYELGHGIVGGPLNPTDALGRQAASVAVRILKGIAPSDIKTPPMGFGVPEYDWRELQRWNISEALLPPNSIVRSRPPTAWEQYQWQITLIALTVLLQSALIGWLIFEHRRRRTAEALARRTVGELANVNRIATAGELSASIAHEMKQPLAAMVMSVQAGLRWLGAAEPNLEEARAALQSAVKDGSRAAQVVDSVRAMFKRQQTDKTLLYLNDLISSVLYLLRDELQPQHIILRTNLDPQLPPVQGHRGELQQVILNLVRNAADAMSSVTVRPRVLTVRSETQPPSDVLISIGDSGTGIDPKNIDHIFAAFFTTKSNGMGMGLSICKSIIEDHSGRLWALPNVKYGSVFNISLPIAEVASASPRK